MDDERADVVVWRGQYLADAQERLDTLKRCEVSIYGLRDAEIAGRAGDWWIILKNLPIARA